MFRRILLVKPDGRRGLGFASDMIPIGLEYIAAAIKDVVDDVNIIDMSLEQAPIQYLLDSLKPDLVGITMSATDHIEGLRIASIAKKENCTTILGGYHPSAIPDELLTYPEVDLVIRGEGEYTMKELIQADSPKDVLGLSHRENGEIVHNGDRPLIRNLDLLPFPARYLRRHKYHDHIAFDREMERDVITISRGCWGRCSFCCEPLMNRGYQRLRSPENVMNELLEIVSFHQGAPLYIFVTDPNFMGSPKRVECLCDLLKKSKLDLRFSVLVRVDSIVRNPELAKKMCDNGILNYELGIESPKAEDLENTQKGIALEMQEKAVKILRENGAWVGGTFVIGLSNQTETEIKRFPIYAKKIGLTGAAFGIATPFPGTRLYKDLEQRGLIVERDWTKYDEMHSVFELKNMSRERLEELMIYCHTKFWTLDTLIDHARTSLKSDDKIPLEDFIRGLLKTLSFAWNATSDSKTADIMTNLKIAIEAGADPCVKEYTKEVGLHNIIEFPKRFFKVLGPQTMQFTFKSKQVPITSYIMKTTGSTVEYIDAISGRREDATINLDVNLEDIDLFKNNNTTIELLKNCIKATISLRSIDEIWYRLRLLVAIGVESTYQIMHQKIKAL